MKIKELIFESESSIGLIYTVKYESWFKEKSMTVWIGKYQNGELHSIAEDYHNGGLPIRSSHLRDIIVHNHEINKKVTDKL